MFEQETLFQLFEYNFFFFLFLLLLFSSFRLCRERRKKARFIDKISTCKCVVNGWPAWFVWKLPAPESFVPPINHVTNFSRIAWFLIDKLTRPLNFRFKFFLVPVSCVSIKSLHLLPPISVMYQKYRNRVLIQFLGGKNGRFFYSISTKSKFNTWPNYVILKVRKKKGRSSFFLSNPIQIDLDSNNQIFYYELYIYYIFIIYFLPSIIRFP